MTIAVKDMTVAKTHPRKTYFAHSFYSTNASGCEEIKAAHATKPYYIEHLLIASKSDGIIDFGDGKDTSAVETIALEVQGAQPWDITWKRAIALTAAKGITIDCSNTGAISGMVEGFYIT